MASDNNIRCAKCTFIVLQMFPDMMKDLLADIIPPSALYNMIMKSEIPLKAYEKGIVSRMNVDGFRKLDVSLMYSIFKFFNLISPTRPWGANPLTNETKLGDDIERMRRARNDLVHKCDANVSKQSFTEFFDSSIAIGERFDKYLKKLEGSSYKNRILLYKSCLPDQTTINQLLEDRQEEECLKQIGQFSMEPQQKEVHIMAGKSMDDVLLTIKSIEDESMLPIKIIIHGLEDSQENVDRINVYKNELTSDNIIFKRAEKNCIILFTEMKNKVLKNHSMFVEEVTCLIEEVFRLGRLTYKDDEITYVVVTSAEEEIVQDNFVEYEEGGPSLFGNDDKLVLHIDIKNKAFLSDDTVEQVFTEFFDKVVKTGKRQTFIGKKTVHAVLVHEEGDELSERSEDENRNKLGKDYQRRLKDDNRRKTEGIVH